MISNTTAKLLVNSTDYIKGNYCPGENNSFYRADFHLDRIKLVDGQFEKTLILQLDKQTDVLGLESKFVFAKDEYVYYMKNGRTQKTWKVNVLTGEETQFATFRKDFTIDQLVNCEEMNMMAIPNNEGIWVLSLKNGELNQINKESWHDTTYSAYFNEVLFLLHKENFYAFHLIDKKYVKLLEGLTYDNFARFVIKNGFVYFFGEFLTKMLTYNLLTQETAQVDISIDSETPPKIVRIMLSSLGNVIVFTEDQLWEITLN